MPKETMSRKERWKAVLRREKPDRVPMDFQGTPEVLAAFMKYAGVSSERALWKKYHIDQRIRLDPRYCGPVLPADQDQYGCRFRMVDYGGGSYCECVAGPLERFETVNEIQEGYQWPDVIGNLDFSGIQAEADRWADYPIVVFGSEPFLYYKYLRGEAQAFMDLAVNPDIVEFCLGKLYDVRYAVTRRVLESLRPGTVDMVIAAEDMGSQTGLLYSPDQIRQFFIPHFKRMIELAHQHGAYAFHHSDGAIRPIIPDLIEAGFNILNPVQHRCPGMNREGLKRDFGDKLIFHGAVENQQILPFGTPAQVRQEVLENLRILGAGGGYILGPCHKIQPVSPMENIVALYETGYAEGWY